MGEGRIKLRVFPPSLSQGVCQPTSADEYARIEKIVAVSNLMLAINSASNFIIYMLRYGSV